MSVLYEKLLNIVKEYGVKLIFEETEYDGYYSDNIKTIGVNKKFLKKRALIPIVFHELGHNYCFKKNLFFHYHHEDNIRLAKLTALKAERYVDRWAEKEMKKHGYKMKYPMFYYNKDRTNEFKKLVKNGLFD